MVLYYAAGILPVCRHPCGEAMVLLGKDVRPEAGFSDLAGKAERVDRSDVIATACREAFEETLGLISNPKNLRRFITPETSILLRGRTQNSFPYFQFLIEIPYMSDLRSRYRDIVEFLQFRNLHRQLVEKTDLQYVLASKLFDDSFPKRPVFTATINANRQALSDIIEAVERGDNWRDICSRYTWDPDDLL